MNTQLKEIIEHFDKSCVLVIGDLMMDQYLYGTVTRISPEAPVPIVNIEREACELGGAANAVNNIINLGGEVDAVGVIGKEDAGRKLLNLFKEKNVNTDGIILSEDRPTTVKTRVIGNGSHIVRLDKETRKNIESEISDQIIEHIRERIIKYDAILISDYDKGLITPFFLRKLIPLSKSHEIPIVVNSRIENLIYYKNVSVVISDCIKASQVIGIKPIHETSIRNIGQWMLTHLDCKGVLITRGKKGMSVFDKEGNVKHLSSISKDISDIIGLEDAVTGVMTLAMANGSNVIDAAIIANAASTIVLGKTGTYTPSKEELLEQLQ